MNDLRHNQYAHDKEGNDIYVLDVTSGRNNYLCPGCRQEVIAIHRSKESWQPYFRHLATDVLLHGECTYRDETTRHKIAKEILQRIKKIKVPGLRKPPPKGEEGPSMHISDSHFVHAHTILVERQFYEGEDNLIHFGSNPEIKVREHLIKPDVTFLDRENHPILFVEIEATHKVDAEKYAKIKHLGIDTVQVKIPRSSPQEIENSFLSVKYSKWIFNKKYETTPYIQAPGPVNGGVSDFVENEERIFEENFACRSAQIGNLIRAIDRCYQSEQYKETESAIGRALHKATELTERLEYEHDELRGRIEDRVFESFKRRLESLRTEQVKVDSRYSRVESRYSAKREELEQLEREYETRVKELGGTGKSIDDRKRELTREAAKEDRIIRETESDIERTESELGRVRESNREFPEKEKRGIKQLEDNTRREIQKVEREQREVEQKEAGLGDWFTKSEKGQREKFDKDAELFTESVRTRSKEGKGEAYVKLRGLLKKHGRYDNLKAHQSELERLRVAKKWFESAPWKSWS